MGNYDFDAMPGHVAQYENGPPMFVPGYEASQYMAATILAERVGDRARILINGAGGGLEMGLFARLFPDWRFAAVDPSRAMLEQAKARMAAWGVRRAQPIIRELHWTPPMGHSTAQPRSCA